MRNKSLLKTNLLIGGLITGVLMAINGLMEVMLNFFKWNIINPRSIKEFLIFSLFKNFHLPYSLDKFFGPELIPRLWLAYNIIFIYLVAGLVLGLTLGMLTGLLMSLVQREFDEPKLVAWYTALIISTIIFFNFRHYLLMYPWGRIEPILVQLSIIFNCFFISKLIYNKLPSFLRNSKIYSSLLAKDFTYKYKLVTTSLVLPWVLISGYFTFYPAMLESSPAVPKTIPQLVKATTPNTSHKNVILISIDSLRSDHLGCYGYKKNTSPNIDKLATEGVLFANAFSTTSWTLPAHMSMLTSLYTFTHGVNGDSDKLDSARVTLAETLKRHGYKTAGFVTGPYLNSPYGFSQGFDSYDDHIIFQPPQKNPHIESHKDITSPRLTKTVFNWLEKNHESNFFLFLHYFDVHYDYIPPPPYDKMFDPTYQGTISARNFERGSQVNRNMDPDDLKHIIALYDGEIRWTDKHIGLLFDKLGELNLYHDTLIILTADHGEEFFEHRQKGHQRNLYDEVLQVPLILKFPAQTNAGETVNTQVDITDIMPTILDFSSLPVPQEAEGASMLPLIHKNSPFPKLSTYSQLYDNQVAVRTLDYKLIYYFRYRFPLREWFELFNLKMDHAELNNMAYSKDKPGNISKTDKLVSELCDWLNHKREVARRLKKDDESDQVVLKKEVKEKLRSLGYMN